MLARCRDRYRGAVQGAGMGPLLAAVCVMLVGSGQTRTMPSQHALEPCSHLVSTPPPPPQVGTLAILTFRMLMSIGSQFEEYRLFGTWFGSLLNVLWITVMNVVYRLLAARLTELENHRTPTECDARSNLHQQRHAASLHRVRHVVPGTRTLLLWVPLQVRERAHPQDVRLPVHQLVHLALLHRLRQARNPHPLRCLRPHRPRHRRRVLRPVRRAGQRGQAVLQRGPRLRRRERRELQARCASAHLGIDVCRICASRRVLAGTRAHS